MRSGSGSGGFSLIELLVALVCTALVSAAVFSLLVGSAAAVRNEWGTGAAERAATTAVAMVSSDAEAAGTGLESASTVQQAGARFPLLGSDGSGSARMVLARGPVLEVRRHLAPGRYRVAASSGLRFRDRVAAVGQPDRPVDAAIPLGVVVAVSRLPEEDDLMVAWHPAEAARLAEWGEPRALVEIVVREYAARSVGGVLRLDRRDNGGPRQPVVDRLDRFELEWLVDIDEDGVADARRRHFDDLEGGDACALRIVASSRASATRQPGGDPRPAPLIEAVRWVDLGAC